MGVAAAVALGLHGGAAARAARCIGKEIPAALAGGQLAAHALRHAAGGHAHGGGHAVGSGGHGGAHAVVRRIQRLHGRRPGKWLTVNLTRH